MTQRERQILNWIEENPLISQQELAEKAGITRSSVAVHISNLMKKGYITGTEDRVMPAFSASSCWEIRGFSSIQFRICRSRWVMAPPPCKQKLR